MEKKGGKGKRREKRGREERDRERKRGVWKIFENERKEIRMVGDMFEIQGYMIRY